MSAPGSAPEVLPDVTVSPVNPRVGNKRAAVLVTPATYPFDRLVRSVEAGRDAG
jgi:hypothetical protein